MVGWRFLNLEQREAEARSAGWSDLDLKLPRPAPPQISVRGDLLCHISRISAANIHQNQTKRTVVHAQQSLRVGSQDSELPFKRIKLMHDMIHGKPTHIYTMACTMPDCKLSAGAHGPWQ